MTMRNSLIGLLALAACSSAAAGKTVVQLNPGHPEQYRVAAGDTLWQIAGKFLKDPWQWPDLWGSDRRQAIQPLRPGDVLTLVQQDGKPRLQLQRAGEEPATAAVPRRPGQPLPEVKLSPHIRRSDLAAEIPTIPMNAIRAFLSSPQIVEEGELEDAPYLLEFGDGRLVGGSGDKTYVRKLDDEPLSSYGVYHPGAVYRDGESGEVLGREATQVGEAHLQKAGDPAIYQLAGTLREARVGDRLLPLQEERVAAYFEPHAPAFDVKGRIIGILGGEDIGSIRNSTPRIGQYSVVVLDRGSKDGLEAGHVLDVYQQGRKVHDRVSGIPYDDPTLPEEAVGNVLIFRPFERVSFALVMNATRDLFAGDAVQTPE